MSGFNDSYESFSDRASLIEARGKGGSLVDADLSFLDLRDINLSGLDLSGAVFTGSDLTGANLEKCDLSSIFAQDAKMGRMRVKGGIATQAFFQQTSLDGVDFSGLELSEVNFLLCQMPGVHFDGANLPGSTIMTCN
ncbi:MAG: pentapeptide repeat-containing protein, partial [Gammaproteobacteria bacterium]|nr:pentapeptide repeat-containing protein [Gammaproteobacteria bacterium]